MLSLEAGNPSSLKSKAAILISGYKIGLYKDNGKQNENYYLRFRV